MRPKPTTPEKVFYAASKPLSQPLTYEVSYAWSVDGNGVGGAATADIWTKSVAGNAQYRSSLKRRPYADGFVYRDIRRHKMKRILILLSILALIVGAAGCTSSTSSNQAGVNIYREL